jgi:transcriptional regulator with XRE-family HTH domain
MAAGVLTLPRLLLGEALKKLRTDSGKTLDEVAAVIGKSRARLINILDGKGTLTAKELERLLDFLHVGTAQKRKLLALGVEARQRPSRRPYSDLLPTTFERLADLESMATEICYYERGVIPGPLQTPEYIEAIMADGDGIWWDSSWEERHKRLLFRLGRQKLIMDDPGKTLRFVVTEDSLTTEVGGPEIMTSQLMYLLSLVERPNIHVRVLPTSVRHNPSPSAGFTLLRLGAERRPVGMLQVVYGPSLYLDNPVDAERLSRAFTRVEELATSEDGSRQLIARLAKGTTW